MAAWAACASCPERGPCGPAPQTAGWHTTGPPGTLGSVKSSPPPSSSALPVSESSLRRPATAGYVAQVVLRSFATPIEAEMARSRLDAADIDATLLDEHLVGVASHLTYALGGVRLAVAESDAERARGVLGDEDGHKTHERVFRVRQTRGFVAGLAGMVLGLGVGGAVARHPAAGAGLALVLMTASGAAGRRWYTDVCSELDCSVPIPSGALVCPGCGGQVLGVIQHRDQRLAAEDVVQQRETTLQLDPPTPGE